MAHSCYMVKGFGLAHYFPADCVFNILVLQVPNVLWQTGGIFRVPGFKARFVVSPPVFKRGWSQSYVCVRFLVTPLNCGLVNYPLLQASATHRTLILLSTVTLFAWLLILLVTCSVQNFCVMPLDFQLDYSPSLQSRPILSSSTWGCYVYYCIAQFIIIIIILIIINTV